MKKHNIPKVDAQIFCDLPQIDDKGGVMIAIRRTKIEELFSRNYSNGFDQRKFIAETAKEENVTLIN